MKYLSIRDKHLLGESQNRQPDRFHSNSLGRSEPGSRVNRLSGVFNTWKFQKPFRAVVVTINRAKVATNHLERERPRPQPSATKQWFERFNEVMSMKVRTRTRNFVIVFSLSLLIAWLILPRELRRAIQPTASAAAKTFTVNVTGNGADANPGDGVCETGVAGNCSLRAAIQEANANPGKDTINFNIP